MHKPAIGTLASILALALAAPVAAQGAPASPPTSEAAFALFVPRGQVTATQLDYGFWDEMLKAFVFRMGRSNREGAPSIDPTVGTRFVYGHTSRYRLEGNRVAFNYLEPGAISALTQYREDLQRIAGEIDITSLSRNEQLAFWLNLHNVAVIEQIALAYPLGQPRELRFGDAQTPLDEARFITIRGVAMSPRDIRTRIVFPHWRDPRVIYGFFRGEIGGPSILAEAYKADNVANLLDQSAREFVNSLRGTDRSGNTLQVSRIYAEAMPFFFAGGDGELAAHLKKYANDEVGQMIAATSSVEPSIYEYDIADLSKGEIEPVNLNVVTQDENGNPVPPNLRVPANIARLVSERNQKLDRMVRDADRTGNVIVAAGDTPAETAPAAEVE